METLNYYGHPVSVVERKTDITAKELNGIKEQKEYRQAVLIAVCLLLIPVAVGVLSQIIGYGNSY